MQFRAEAFKVLNHTNFRLPTNQFNLFSANGTPISTGGVLDSTSIDSREIHLGLENYLVSEQQYVSENFGSNWEEQSFAGKVQGEERGDGQLINKMNHEHVIVPPPQSIESITSGTAES